MPHDHAVNVWSVVCLYVQRRHRRRGVSAVLLRATIAAAIAHGADILEPSLVDPDSPSYRFMGFRSLFFEAGFREVGTVGTRRHVMELALSP